MILISPGHHPKARGACYGDVCEFPLTMLWAEEIYHKIKESGIAVDLVPAAKLLDKVNFINSKPSTIAAEIHFNSDTKRAGRGAEVLYCPGSKKGYNAAQNMQVVLSGVFENRGIKEGWYQLNKSKGVDYFLLKTKCPAIIIEPEFIHNYMLLETKMKLACDLIAQSLIGSFYELKGAEPHGRD